MTKLTLEEKKEQISKMSLRQLNSRRKLINWVIRQTILANDKYAHINGGLKTHKQQLKNIDREILKRRRENYKNNGGKPPGIEIQVKPGTLGAKSKRIGG